MKKQIKPIKLRTEQDDAWAYIDNKSIEIYIRKTGVAILTAKITERQILKALGSNK